MHMIKYIVPFVAWVDNFKFLIILDENTDDIVQLIIQQLNEITSAGRK